MDPRITIAFTVFAVLLTAELGNVYWRRTMNKPLPVYGRIRGWVIGAGVAIIAVLPFVKNRRPDLRDDTPRIPPRKFDDDDHRKTDARADDTDLSALRRDRDVDGLDARARDRDARLAELERGTHPPDN